MSKTSFILDSLVHNIFYSVHFSVIVWLNSRVWLNVCAHLSSKFMLSLSISSSCKTLHPSTLNKNHFSRILSFHLTIQLLIPLEILQLCYFVILFYPKICVFPLKIAFTIGTLQSTANKGCKYHENPFISIKKWILKKCWKL